MKENGVISKYGLFSSIVVSVVGVGVFSYPSRMANIVGTDGWIVTIAAGAICFLFLNLIYRVVVKNSYATFYNILEANLGKLIGRVFGFVFCAYFIFLISFGMRIFSEVIKMYLLEQTPTEFILLIMILTGLYIVRSDIYALVKFNEIAAVAMFLPMILLLIFATRGGEFANVLPVLQAKPYEYIKALESAGFAFGGFEIAYLVMPYMKVREGVRKTMFNSILLITFFYVAVVILCLMFFSKEHTKTLLWPTITLIRAIVIPGAFVERWEGIVMALWVIFYFTTFINLFYFSGDIIKEALNLRDIKLSSILVTPIIYILALYPQNIAEVYDFSDKLTPYFTLFSFILLPVILLIASSFKRRRKNEV